MVAGKCRMRREESLWFLSCFSHGSLLRFLVMFIIKEFLFQPNYTRALYECYLSKPYLYQTQVHIFVVHIAQLYKGIGPFIWYQCDGLLVALPWCEKIRMASCPCLVLWKSLFTFTPNKYFSHVMPTMPPPPPRLPLYVQTNRGSLEKCWKRPHHTHKYYPSLLVPPLTLIHWI